MGTQVEKWLFHVDEYHRMAEAGILRADDRVELIEGEIVKMSPIGRRHRSSVGRLTTLFSQVVGSSAIVWVQNSIELDDLSEPQPDIALLRPQTDFYLQSGPYPEDIFLVVEVSDSSEAYDRDVKVPLYARSGIPEVWLLKLGDDAIMVYSRPENGAYRDVRKVHRGETISPLSLPHLVFKADDILG